MGGLGYGPPALPLNPPMTTRLFADGGELSWQASVFSSKNGSLLRRLRKTLLSSSEPVASTNVSSSPAITG